MKKSLFKIKIWDEFEEPIDEIKGKNLEEMKDRLNKVFRKFE